MLMYNVALSGQSFFAANSSPAYDFGTGDFSVCAMVMTTKGGPVVAYRWREGPGYMIDVGWDSTIGFLTSDGQVTLQVRSGPTSILDGACHTLLAVRQGAAMRIVLDGVPLRATGAGPWNKAPLNISNHGPLTIGAVWTTEYRYFTGAVMNVGIWSKVLDGHAAVAAAFARVTASDPGLQGYWTFDRTTADSSRNGNPAQSYGTPVFQPCLDCVFTSGANDYAFCQIANAPAAADRADAGVVASDPVGQFHSMAVRPGTPALFASIMSASDTPAFPAGVSVTITDPSGRRYDTDTSTDTLCVVTRDGQPWGMAAINPQPGTWRVAVTSPAAIGFALQMQTCPATAVVATITDSLTPLYGQTASLARAQVGGGWLNVLGVFAVAAVAGVVVAVLVGGSGGALLPVAAGIVAFASVSYAGATLALPEVSTHSLQAARTQVGGMAGFLVAVDGLLLADANDDDDNLTPLIYKRRAEVLYPYVTASPFNKKQQQLTGRDDIRPKARQALLSFGPGYVSMSGHGEPEYLSGWKAAYPAEDRQVLKTGSYDQQEVRSKIIHMMACSCGSTKDGGLGRDLVKQGATAFFGYSDVVTVPTNDAEYPAFIDCDIEIDKALIDGKTCGQAYQAAIDKYTDTIARLRGEGKVQYAAALSLNKDRLVAPSTDAAYGDETAHLDTIPH